MTKKTVGLEELAKCGDQYILLSNDKTKILVTAKTIKELEVKAEKLKIKDGILEYIPPINTALSLICK